MDRYHISPKTGNPNKCSAKPGGCPFKSDEGGELQHYSTKQEAQAGYEKEMEAKAAKKREDEAAAKELNWPTPPVETIEAFENKGYRISPKHKALELTETSNGIESTVVVDRGSARASLRFNRSLGSAFSISESYVKVDGEYKPTYTSEFSDYGTSLSRDEAVEHIDYMERVLKEAPLLIERTQQASDDAEVLFGRPADHPENLYSPIDKLNSVAPTPPAVEQPFVVESEKFGDRLMANVKPEANDYGKIRPEIYSLGTGERRSISMPSANGLTIEQYRERAIELKNAVATLDKMNEAYDALK